MYAGIVMVADSGAQNSDATPTDVVAPPHVLAVPPASCRVPVSHPTALVTEQAQVHAPAPASPPVTTSWLVVPDGHAPRSGS
jgi:hypothetical protein